MPDYDFADDGRAYAAERAAYERRERIARLVIDALTACAQPVAQKLPTRETHERHLELLSHFVGMVREKRQRLGHYWNGGSIVAGWLRGAGITWPEVEREIRRLEAEEALRAVCTQCHTETDRELTRDLSKYGPGLRCVCEDCAAEVESEIEAERCECMRCTDCDARRERYAQIERESKQREAMAILYQTPERMAWVGIEASNDDEVSGPVGGLSKCGQTEGAQNGTQKSNKKAV